MNTERLNVSNTIQSGGFIKQHHSMLIGMHQLADVLLIWGLLTVLVNLAGHNWEVCYQVAAFVSSLCYHILKTACTFPGAANLSFKKLKLSS